MKKSFLLLLTLSLLLSCNSKTEVNSHEYTGEALGTTYMVHYFSEKDLKFENSLDSILGEINNSMSTYIAESDISKINRGDTTVKVDDHFFKVFNASQRVFKETDGFFDPTVGVLVNAYGFGPGKPLKEIDSIKLDSLKKLVGLDKINLKSDRTLEKEDPNIYLDFNAIAKGYTIDVIANYLESKEVSNYLIELGGELRAKGKNLESDKGWIVGIDAPKQYQVKRDLQAKLELTNAAMATSGNYRKFRIDSLSGRKYVHTVNPKTGEAERSNLLSASVLAENCMLADAYATAFMALGLERTKQTLQNLDKVEVYILYSDEEGKMEIFSTPGFQKQLLE